MKNNLLLGISVILLVTLVSELAHNAKIERKLQREKLRVRLINTEYSLAVNMLTQDEVETVRELYDKNETFWQITAKI